MRILLGIITGFSSIYCSTSCLSAETFNFSFTAGYGTTPEQAAITGTLTVDSGQIVYVTGTVYGTGVNVQPGALGPITGLLAAGSFPSGYPMVYNQPPSLLNDNLFNSSYPYLTSSGFAFSSGSGLFNSLSALTGSPQQYAYYSESAGVVPGEMTFSLPSNSPLVAVPEIDGAVAPRALFILFSLLLLIYASRTQLQIKTGGAPST
jgi:hypothetical protein